MVLKTAGQACAGDGARAEKIAAGDAGRDCSQLVTGHD